MRAGDPQSGHIMPRQLNTRAHLLVRPRNLETPLETAVYLSRVTCPFALAIWPQGNHGAMVKATTSRAGCADGRKKADSQPHSAE